MAKISMKAFYSLFNFAFYLFWVFMVVVVGLEIAKWTVADFSLDYSFTFIQAGDLQNPNPEKFELNATPDVKDPHLLTNEWRLTFKAASWQVQAFMSALSLIFVGFIMVVLLKLRTFVLSLQRNETFTTQNIKRLQTIGLLFLLIEPFKWIVKYFVKRWLLVEYFNLDIINRSIAYEFGYVLGTGKFILNWIFVGLIVLVIAEVFKQGLKLKEEVDLTV